MDFDFLISIDELKEITPISGNVDETLFTQTVLFVQDIYVQDIVGTALYNDLLSEVRASSMTPINTTLVNNYLQPAMRFYIMAEMVRPLAIRFENVGIMQNNTESSQPVTGADLTTTEDYYRRKAEIMAQRAADYLCANSALFPLYENPGTDGDTIHPKKNQITTNIAWTYGKNNRRH